MLLVISDRGELCKSLVCALAARGVFSYSAPFETGIFLCKQKDIGGVLLDCVPNLKQGEKICNILRTQYPAIPIAALISENDVPDFLADAWLRSEDLSEITEYTHRFFTKICGWRAEPLSTYSLYVTLNPHKTRYMGYRLLLTPGEHRILRCLFYHSPHPTTTDDLLTLCYPFETVKSGIISVCVHNINTQASRIDPRQLILYEHEKGYYLRAGL